MTVGLAVFMAVMGVGIAGLWSVDIVRARAFDARDGRLRARSEGSLLLPHWVAEFGTAAALLVAAGALVADVPWATVLAAAALGATLYTSTNSLGWALAEPDRRPYAVPMVLGLVGSLGSLGVLLG